MQQWNTHIYLELFLLGYFSLTIIECIEYRPYDGWFNNRAHPDWGGSETQLIRRVSTAYSDGVYKPAGADRPNPFELSEHLMKGDTGKPSERNLTAFLVFFGQQVVEEILDAQRPGCPREYFNIPIPKNHSKYNPDSREGMEMPILRSRYDMRTGHSPNNPRQQLNEISSYIDGTLIYGPNKAWADALRSYKDGLLAATNDTDPMAKYFPAKNDIRLPYANPPPPRDHKLKPVHRFYKIGNPRGNENPFLLTFGILWFRFHNFMARRIKSKHPNYSDEHLFNEARKWTIAIHQQIILYEWLPGLLGKGEQIDSYEAYNSQVHPGVSSIFQSAAMRFGHTLVPPGVYRRNKKGEYRNTSVATGFPGFPALRTCNTYWNSPESMEESDIEEFLLGMSSQITEKDDNIITPDLRGDVFGSLDFSRRDLMAINIQRGRDHGLPDYNTARRDMNLPYVNSFKKVNKDLLGKNRQLLNDFISLYKEDMDNIDIWVGGLLETTPQGPGDLFKTVIKDQFLRIRDGDRFWFENRENGLFTKHEIDEIKKFKIKDVIMHVTNIEDADMQDNPFTWGPEGNFGPYPQPAQLSEFILSNCTEPKGFDYFIGSEVSFILTFAGIAVFLIVCILSLYCTSKSKRISSKISGKTRKDQAEDHSLIKATEWHGKKEGKAEVLLRLDEDLSSLVVFNSKKRVKRIIDLNVSIKMEYPVEIVLGVDQTQGMMAIKVKNEYDLILFFADSFSRSDFLQKLKEFFDRLKIVYNPEHNSTTPNQIMAEAVTRSHRMTVLEKFLKLSFSLAFEDKDLSIDQLTEEDHNIMAVEITRYEFANSLGVKPDSLFVLNMFQLMDRDGNGFISIREFLDVMIVFMNGKGSDKATTLFKMYDLEKKGYLSVQAFKQMIKSLLELASDDMDQEKFDSALQAVMSKSRLSNDRVTMEDFKRMLSDYDDVLNYTSLEFEVYSGAALPKKPLNKAARVRDTFKRTLKQQNRNDSYESIDSPETSLNPESSNPKSPTPGNARFGDLISFMQNQRRQIFWVTLYILVCIGIFAERAYYYSVEREHVGLRRHAGYGVTVTRGAASGMMFTFASLLVTMCRNSITFLRETFLNRYIPFDDYIRMHKLIAWIALFFTVIHVIGHAINFYHISTQTADDLTCIFRDFHHASDELPKFHHWCYCTVTGLTGVLLTLILILMYVFASPYGREHAFRQFWRTHNLYIIFYILLVLHGCGRLVQAPFTHLFLSGPLVLFTLDKLVSISRKKKEIAVINAEILPNDVIMLEIQKPLNFEYKSGQWIKIACATHNHSEFHPFTLSSAPHEDNLTVHIRAVGPWTRFIKETYDPISRGNNPYPKIFMDGPFGEGHQDWYKYEVSVLIGAGIGVTPFSSILKDIAHYSSSMKNASHTMKVRCKKIYFLWVTRTQKQFEWVTDILRQVENDADTCVTTHIYITQFKKKFDIRTTMLYVCEHHFVKQSGRSLFSGLKAKTHFDRPHWSTVFKNISEEHPKTDEFGVFTCGPPGLTNSVEKACASVNSNLFPNAIFNHHYENF